MIDTQKLYNQIQTLNQIIDWVNHNLSSNEQTEYFKYLVERRRKMKRIYRSLTVNPTIAAYGESQKGKSYIVTSLLRRSTDKNELMVKDENGRELDFITNFNYKTKDQESTGVITRFTTDTVSTDDTHPIKLRIMSLADVIMLLADCYMRSVADRVDYEKADLQQKAEEQVKDYSNKELIQDILIEDDVYDICDYLVQSNSDVANKFKDSGWFDRMAMIVRKIPLKDIAKEFSCLWFGDETFTKLLEMIIDNLAKIKFSKEVFIDSKPVLNDRNDGAYTLMSVVALNDEEYGIQAFYNNDGVCKVDTPVVLPQGVSVMIPKSLLSLITFEVVYHVDVETLKGDINFHDDQLRPSKTQSVEQIKSMLHAEGFNKPTNRSFLYRETDPEKIKDENVCFDLLDFPGARAITKIKAQNVRNELAELMLRAKVLFMFQKYSYERLISILMLCHDHKNSATGGAISEQISKWINLCIGEDVQTRTRRIADYKLSPLFIISTKYNCDLVVAKDKDKVWRMDQDVFQQRLIKRLKEEIIRPKSYDWFEHWTADGRFDNTFLLRDFKYSSKLDDVEGHSGLFEGYPGDEIHEYHKEERMEIKNFFLEEECVKYFFKNPELMWDAASTQGNDGSYYLFKQLNVVAPNVNKARANALLGEFDQYIADIIKRMMSKFHQDDQTSQLKTSIMQARRMNFAMTRALNEHEDFFGKFIQHLQLTSNYTNELFSSIIHGELINKHTDSGQYEMIIKDVELMGYSFKPNDMKYNFEVLAKVYGIESKDDPIFEGVDFNELFNPTFKNTLSPSYVMVSTLVDRWLESITKQENNLYLLDIQFSASESAEFYTRLKGMVDYIGLKAKLAEAIRDYVDYVPAIQQDIIPLISDIVTNMFNAFIMDMGYSYLSAEVLNNVRKENDEYKLQLTFDYELEEMSSDDGNADEELDKAVRQQLFESLEALGNGVQGQQLSLPAYSSMKRWLEFVTIAYIVNFAHQDWGYTPEENARLGELINDINQ